MSSPDILTEEFAQAAAIAGLRARQNALTSGHPVVFVDDCGRYVEELPDASGNSSTYRPQSSTKTTGWPLVRAFCRARRPAIAAACANSSVRMSGDDMTLLSRSIREWDFAARSG